MIRFFDLEIYMTVNYKKNENNLPIRYENKQLYPTI